MRFRPCIDLHNGKVKQIIGASLTDNNVVENFHSNLPSSYYAELYKKDNLVGGHIIKLGPNNDEAAKLALQTYPNKLQIGGGITDLNAKNWLNYGASHIIVTSFVFKDGKINFKNLEKLVSIVGKENIVLDLSCKKKDDDYFVVTDRWQNFTNYNLNKKNIRELESYCDEFLIHAADVEGKMGGVDTELIDNLSFWCSIPITYAGGVASYDDINIVNSVGKGKIDLTIGSALDIFGGKLNYKIVIEKFKNLEQ